MLDYSPSHGVFQKTFSAHFGELKASNNVTEIKTTLFSLKKKKKASVK